MSGSWILRTRGGAVIAEAEAGVFGAFADFVEAHGAHLRGADLRGADLRGADLAKADLTGADLRSAKLESARLDGALLVGARLERARLDAAHLKGADLAKARLRRARLVLADLTGAHLDGADFSGADMHCATLDGVEGEGVVFREALLTNVTLRSAMLSRPDFMDARFVDFAFVRPGRRMPQDPTEDALVVGGTYLGAAVPEDYRALVRDNRVSGFIQSLPSRAASLAIPTPPGLKTAAGVLGGLVSNRIEQGIIDRIVPRAVKNGFLALADGIGLVDAGHGVQDWLRDRSEQLAVLVAPDRSAPLRRSLATSGADPAESAGMGYFGLRSGASRSTVGELIFCDGTANEDAVEVVAMAREGLPRRHPVTLVDAASGPDDGSASSLRVDASGVAAAWFEGERLTRTIYYGRDGVPRKLREADGAVVAAPEALRAAPSLKTVLEGFVARTGILGERPMQVPVRAARVWHDGRVGAWAPEQEERVVRGPSAQLYVELRPFLDAAAEEYRAVRDREGLKENRALVLWLGSANVKTARRDRLSAMMDRIGANIEGAGALEAASYAEGLRRVGAALRGHARDRLWLDRVRDMGGAER